ncbi:MAG: flavodoxin family protein [Coriobacteriia bacterium]|nr:flavodoxin family protein [Coriobacteriia bacterium]
MGKQSVLIISGSVRSSGNSSLLAREFIDKASDSGFSVTFAAPLDAFELSKDNFSFISFKGIEGCRACDGCNKTGVCVIDDTMRPLYHAFDEAAALCWISPIYFGGVPAPLKAVIDRFQAFYSRRLLGAQPIYKYGRKPASLVLLGGGGDPFGYRAAEITVRSASNMAEATLQKPVIVQGVDKAHELYAPEHEEALLDARAEFEALLEVASHRVGRG